LNTTHPKALRLDYEHMVQMYLDVRKRAPEEACGLLFGKGEQVEKVIAVTNILHSPNRYRMNPQEQYHLMKNMEDLGWDLLAIYHSHPQGPPYPSPIDVREAYYPNTVYLIWGIDPKGGWECKGYLIHRGLMNSKILEVPIEVNMDWEQEIDNE